MLYSSLACFRRIARVLFLLGMFLPAAGWVSLAKAVVVDGSVTGVVGQIYVGQLPSGVNKGDSARITFTYDTNAANDQFSADPSLGQYFFNPAGTNNLELEINGLRWSSGNTFYIDVENNRYYVPFSLYQSKFGITFFDAGSSFPGNQLTGQGALTFVIGTSGSTPNSLLKSDQIPASLADINLSAVQSWQLNVLSDYPTYPPGHYGFGVTLDSASFRLTPRAPLAPSFSLSPTSLNFGTIPTNATSTAQTVALTNTGGSSLSFAKPLLTGADTGDYIITGTTCTTPIAVGQGCSFGVAFSPFVTGVRTAQVALTTTPTTATKFVGLTGTAGAASPSSTKLDLRCATTYEADTIFNHKCHLIWVLRNWFSVNSNDASSTQLFKWLAIGENKAIVEELERNLRLGVMTDNYFKGIAKDSDLLDMLNNNINKTNEFATAILKVEEAILQYLEITSPALEFLTGSKTVIEIIKLTYDAYASIIKIGVLVLSGPETFTLKSYVDSRCDASGLNCGPTYLERAQSVFAAEGEQKMNALLCAKKLTAATCPTAEQVKAFKNTFEVIFHAYRLVGYGETSVANRADIGKALAKTM